MKKITSIAVPLFCLLFFWPLYVLVIILTALFNIIQIRKLIALFHSKKTIRVLFWDAQPPNQSGNFFRVQKWVSRLNNSNQNIKADDWYDFKDPAFTRIRKKYLLNMFVYTFMAYWRFLLCFRACFYNVIIMRREFLLYYEFGGLFMEKFLLSLNRHIVYDIDDKIYEAKGEPRKLNFYTKYIQQQDGEKATHMFKLYKYFFPVSGPLIEKIKGQQPDLPDSHIQPMPMCVDYKRENNKVYAVKKSPIIIGWYGAPIKMKPLEMIVPALNNLVGKYDFKLCVICSVPFENAEAKFPIEFRPWSIETEEDNLRYFDIAVGPQWNNISERRQASTFKVVQYMGFGLVSITSDLSYNRLLIEHGVNGFICQDDEWEKIFEYAFNHQDQFAAIGAKAYEAVYQQNSYDVFLPRMIKFLKFVAAEKN